MGRDDTINLVVVEVRENDDDDTVETPADEEAEGR